MRLDHTGCRVPANEVAPKQNLECRHPDDGPGVPRKGRFGRRTVKFPPGAAHALGEPARDAEHQKDRRQADRGEPPAPAIARHQNGKERDNQKLDACRTRCGDAYCKPLVGLNLLLYGGRDDMCGHQAKPHGCDTAEGQKECPGMTGCRDE